MKINKKKLLLNFILTRWCDMIEEICNFNQRWWSSKYQLLSINSIFECALNFQNFLHEGGKMVSKIVLIQFKKYYFECRK